MNKYSNNTQSGGLGFFDVLLLIFIVLKLTGVIDWSWWAVFIPLWIPLSMIVIVGIISVATAMTLHVARWFKQRNKNRK